LGTPPSFAELSLARLGWRPHYSRAVHLVFKCQNQVNSSDVPFFVDLFRRLEIHDVAGRSTGGKPFQYTCMGFWQTTPDLGNDAQRRR